MINENQTLINNIMQYNKTITKNIMKRKLILTAILLSIVVTTNAQVGIGTSSPNSSAALEITSTTKGVLFPRMTLLERNNISSPAQGLTIYCTNCGPNSDGVLQTYNNNSKWTDHGVVFASGVLASFGYHTNNCNTSSEKFIQYATVDSTAYGLCVEKTERSAQTWGDANAICLGLGKRHPDYTEWRKACDGKTSGSAGSTDSDFLNMTGNWEWASSRPSTISYNSDIGAGSVVAGESNCASAGWKWVRDYAANTEDSYCFRCVR